MRTFFAPDGWQVMALVWLRFLVAVAGPFFVSWFGNNASWSSYSPSTDTYYEYSAGSLLFVIAFIGGALWLASIQGFNREITKAKRNHALSLVGSGVIGQSDSLRDEASGTDAAPDSSPKPDTTG